MKSLITVLFSLISYFCYSQKVESDSISFGTCKTGTEDAKRDFEKGIYNSFSYGFVVDVSPKSELGFNEFYKEYIRKKYSINIQNKGCVVTDYSECYSETARNLIYEKFGKDIFEKSRKEALKEFKKK